MSLKLGFNMFFVIALIVGAPSAHAHGLRKLRRVCQAWLHDLRTTPEEVITADYDESERIELEALTRADFDSLTGRPLSYVAPGSFPWNAVGPIVFHRPRAFSKFRRQAIDEVMQASQRSDWIEEARRRMRAEKTSSPSSTLSKNEWNPQDLDQLLQDGIETSKLILTFKSGRMLSFDVKTSYHPVHVALEDALKTSDTELAVIGAQPEKQIARIEIYHAHPGHTSLDAVISLADVNVAAEMAKYFATRNLNPQIHIFAISGASHDRLVSHYSIQLY